MTTHSLCSARQGAGLLLFGLLVASCPNMSAAKGLYRCELAGSVSYADQPCQGGNATELAPHHRPSADQVTHARALAQREQALAQGLVAQSQARVQQSRSPMASGIRHTALGLAPDTGKEVSQQPPRQASKNTKDPRVTFEIKVPKSPKRGSSKKSRPA
jgi:hypothetical protein